jgi:Uma2 family endonuclease
MKRKAIEKHPKALEEIPVEQVILKSAPMHGPSTAEIFEQPPTEVLDEIFKGVDFTRKHIVFNRCAIAHNVSLQAIQAYEEKVGRLRIEYRDHLIKIELDDGTVYAVDMADSGHTKLAGSISAILYGNYKIKNKEYSIESEPELSIAFGKTYRIPDSYFTVSEEILEGSKPQSNIVCRMALEVLNTQDLTRGKSSILAKIKTFYIPNSNHFDFLILAKPVEGGEEKKTIRTWVFNLKEYRGRNARPFTAKTLENEGRVTQFVGADPEHIVLEIKEEPFPFTRTIRVEDFFEAYTDPDIRLW